MTQKVRNANHLSLVYGVRQKGDLMTTIAGFVLTPDKDSHVSDL